MTILCVIEGPDGSSKTTTCRLVAAMLAPIDARTWHHRPPPPDRPRDPWSLALHYAAERAALAAAIRDGSEESAVVIVDRWAQTAEVFAEARGDGIALALAELEYLALPPPALVVVLDASDATLDARRPDVSAEERRARALYREKPRLWAWGAVVVSSEGAAEDVAREVAGLVRGALASCSCGGEGGHALACGRVWGGGEK